tara:strand:+ start:16533 stop:18380 length:1848 start_codon:yes stop_codon:yes gene_type:complete
MIEQTIIGDHIIYKYDTNKHKFIDFIKKLYNETNLSELHNKSQDYIFCKDRIKLGLGDLNERDSDLHKIFYEEIKKNDEFKKIYCGFIKDIFKQFFPDEKYMIYQTYPSIRFQFENSITIPPHKDSDHLSNHPIGEKNFLIPITEMKNTNSIIIESKPDKKDFKSIPLNPGELFHFNGNLCTHYNEKNTEGKLRISLDFRIILYKDYINSTKEMDIKKTNPRDIEKKREQTLMIIGKYYQICYVESSLKDMLEWYSLSNTIMQHRPTFEIEEAEACYKYMLEDNFITEHKKTLELENMICDYLNVKNCIMTTSGTCAILLALMSLNLPENTEVIVPNYTMIATINSVKFLKLIPIIIDVDIETGTMNSEEIKKHINSNTSAIVHVSLNNRTKCMESIVDLCKEKKIYLIEDSAQSLGCKLNGKSIGTFGIIGCFSLSTPKIISTGQGGFCVTNNDEFAKKIRMIKNFGRKESGKDIFEVFGINLKYTDLQAVIGIEQLKKMEYRVKRMREIYDLYYEHLHKYIKMHTPSSNEWIPWFVDIYIENREELIFFLKQHKIITRPVYGEINKTEIYNSNETLPNSNYICNHGLFLPSFITITNSDIIHICKIIKLFFKV